MRPAIKSNGDEYYEYILLYTDDTLVVSDNSDHILQNGIGKYFELKEETIGPPDIYLGGRMRQVTLENGARAWAFGLSQYIQSAVATVEQYLKQEGLTLPARENTPFKNGY